MYTFKKINAFSDGTYEGNGAGLIYDNDLNDETIMQKIATDMEGFVSEVVYVKDGKGDYDFDLRYFSCESEVPFCGHGTLAAMYHTIEENSALHNKKNLVIRTSKGLLKIENRYAKEQTLYIYAPKKAIVKSEIDMNALAHALNVSIELLDLSVPVANYNAGQNSLLVAMDSADAVMNCKPDYETIRQFCFDNNIAVMNIYASDTVYDESSYRVRVFAPTFGYLEDTATGSANSALGYYLLDSGKWDGETMVIEQGVSRNNPNRIYLSTPEGNKEQVIFGGKSQLKLSGMYYL